MIATPWQAILAKRGYVLVDGGLATELEQRGESLSGSLWSASLIETRPEAIRAVHDDFLAAGADVIIAATYQASFEGFAAAGVDRADARAIMRRAVSLACESRDAHRATALVAASIGPYGAMLGGGAEYGGDYRVSDTVLRQFHCERLRVLGDAGADLLAVETIPADAEARVLAALLNESPGPPAWVCFSCRDGQYLNDGTAIERAAARFTDVGRVAAVGVNCSDPGQVDTLVERIHGALPEKDVVVYPNRGGRWDAQSRHWGEGVCEWAFVELAPRWYDAGARLIGGCCRTSPALVADVGRRLDAHVRESVDRK